jgi:hypothetical protein
VPTIWHSRGLGWRIHESVEDTKLSTNKQHSLSQLAKELRQEAAATAMDSNWRIVDPSKYPQQVCRGLARLLSRREVRGESARLLAKHIGDRLPPGGGRCGQKRGEATSQAPRTSSSERWCTSCKKWRFDASCA